MTLRWTQLLVMAALIGAAFAAFGERPTDVYTVDYRTKGNQFWLNAGRASTPRWVMTLCEGTNTWDATGWTMRLRYFRSQDSEALCTVTGSVAGSVVTFDAGTNVLGEEIKGGYAALVAAQGTYVVTFARGTIDVERAPELGTTNRLRPSVTINGADYGPFVGDFSGWPLGNTHQSYVDSQDTLVSNAAQAAVVAATNWAAGTFALVTEPLWLSWIGTNGMASTNWVLGKGYLDEPTAGGLYDALGAAAGASNGVVAQIASSNFVTAAVTNGLATTNWVASLGYVTSGVTNGLATTNWVLAKGYVTGTVTNGLASVTWVESLGYVTGTVTNGLATTNWVLGKSYVTAAVTNGLASLAATTNAVTYETLNANGDVGVGAAQVAQGSHGHNSYLWSIAWANSTSNYTAEAATVATVYFKTNWLTENPSWVATNAGAGLTNIYVQSNGVWITMPAVGASGAGDVYLASNNVFTGPVQTMPTVQVSRVTGGANMGQIDVGSQVSIYASDDGFAGGDVYIYGRGKDYVGSAGFKLAHGDPGKGWFYGDLDVAGDLDQHGPIVSDSDNTWMGIQTCWNSNQVNNTTWYDVGGSGKEAAQWWMDDTGNTYLYGADSGISELFLHLGAGYGGRPGALTLGKENAWFHGNVVVTGTLNGITISALATNAGPSGGSLYAMSNSVWTAFVPGSGSAVTAHAPSHAGIGADPITSLGAVTYSGTQDLAGNNVTNGGTGSYTNINILGTLSGGGTGGGTIDSNGVLTWDGFPSWPNTFRHVFASVYGIYSCTNTAGGTSINIYRSGGTYQSPSVCSNGWSGALNFREWDGDSWVISSLLQFTADETASLTSTASKFVFWTTPNGSQTPAERMRITSSGLVGINDTTPSYHLDVCGHAQVQSNLYVTGDMYLNQSDTLNRQIFYSTGASSGFDLASTNFFRPSMSVRNYRSDVGCAMFGLMKGRLNGSLSTNAAVSDNTGAIYTYAVGSNGVSTFNTGALVVSLTDQHAISGYSRGLIKIQGTTTNNNTLATALAVDGDNAVRFYNMTTAPSTASGYIVIAATNNEAYVWDGAGNRTLLSAENDDGEMIRRTEKPFAGFAEEYNQTLAGAMLEELAASETPEDDLKIKAKYKGKIYRKWAIPVEDWRAREKANEDQSVQAILLWINSDTTNKAALTPCPERYYPTPMKPYMVEAQKKFDGKYAVEVEK